MTPEQKRKGAFEAFEELVLGGTCVGPALETAAQDNDLRPEVFRTVAENEWATLKPIGIKFGSMRSTKDFGSYSKMRSEDAKLVLTATQLWAASGVEPLNS